MENQTSPQITNTPENWDDKSHQLFLNGQLGHAIERMAEKINGIAEKNQKSCFYNSVIIYH